MPESTERGALTEAVFFILLSLYMPMHGYGMMQDIAERSHGRVNLGAGTLYGALNTLLEKAWIECVSQSGSRNKKEYRITAAGKKAVKNELERLEEILEIGKEVAGGME